MPVRDDAAFAAILAKAKDRSAFDYGVAAAANDHILTLSTCAASTKLPFGSIQPHPLYSTGKNLLIMVQ